MLAAVSSNDWKRGEDPFRILKKSHARYKKHGYLGMLNRLIIEYNNLGKGDTFPLIPLYGYSKYNDWIEKNESRNTCSVLDKYYKPLISVVMPTYNTPVLFLKEAIESVINQTYEHWELCIADDASVSQEMIEILRYYELVDERIKICFRQTNGHISEASNSALSIATGDYVAFFDHDDLLSPDALCEVVSVLNTYPDALLIYSDEDKIDQYGKRYEPHFKSDWNPDLFLSQNYISHLSVLSHEIVIKAGKLRKGFEGSQDYDLLLRAIPLIRHDQIIHIPKILYHWRAITGSTALSAQEKDYTTIAGMKALESYCAIFLPGTTVAKGTLPNTYRVVYPICGPEPMVTLIIPTRNQHEILAKCVTSILQKTNYLNYEIVIVDNQSDDPAILQYFKEISLLDNVKVLKYDHPFNYSAINNFAVKHANGEIIGLINNDIEVISGEWLREMVSHAIRPEIGCVGAKLFYTNGTIQHAGVIIGLYGVAGHGHKHVSGDEHGYFGRLRVVQNYSAVTAACLIVRKEVYYQIGGLDEVLEVAFNDIDFCLKVQAAGYRNLWTPYALLYHHESLSRGLENTPEKRERFEREIKVMKTRWHTDTMNDRYYNLNLTRAGEKFSLSNEIYL